MSKGRGRLLIGYDVECGSTGLPDGLCEVDTTRRFLDAALKVHTDTNCAATIFLTGQCLERNTEAFRETVASGLFDIQQHTYSHQCLKPLMFRSVPHGVPVIGTPGLTAEQLHLEVSKTNRLIRDILGRECIGITGPAGYSLGLCDRPDLLKVLHEEGMRFIRTWGRNEAGYFSFTDKGDRHWIEPFWLDGSGFPDMLEFPFQGNDYNVRREIGWEKIDEYRGWFERQLEETSSQNRTWSYAIHDHSGLRGDPELHLIRELIERAQSLGIELCDYATEYTRMQGASDNG